jgi:site-specific DNA recombinase
MGTVATAKDTSLPTVIYASKSTADAHDSIPGQLATVAERVAAEGGRVEFAGPFYEEERSGWKGDRGPELEAALQAAERAAAEHGTAELWVWRSDRLARGSGRKDEARSLLEVFTRCKRAGVVLRSAEDDAYVRDEVTVGMASKMANKYSEDLSEAVRKGKRRQFEERGERLGGPVCDGYLGLPRPEGEPRRYAPDPERAPIFERMGELADPQGGGLADSNVARQLNAEGYRTKNGRPWDRRRVQDALTNPFYAGMVARGRSTPGAPVETAPGTHPAIIDPERFARIQGARAQRDLGAGSNRRGRPNTRHVAARLGECGLCAREERFSRMYARTSAYTRKDGGRKTTYLCEQVANGTGLCNAPSIDAAIADAALLRHLDHFYLDADAWLAARADEHQGTRERLEAALEAEGARLAALEADAARVRADYRRQLAAGNEAAADVAAAALEDVAGERGQAEHRLGELRATLAATPERPTLDPLLDLYSDLNAHLRGIADDSRTVVEVNEQLRAVIDSIEFYPQEGGAVRLRVFLSDEFIRNKPGNPNDLAIAEFYGAEVRPLVPVLPVVAPSMKSADSQL